LLPLNLRQDARYDDGRLPGSKELIAVQISPPIVETMYRKLGGREVLGEEVTSEADLARLVYRRMPLKVLTYVKRGGFSDQEIRQFIIPERTQRHRKAKKQPCLSG
jgi:hypothetical protein